MDEEYLKYNQDNFINNEVWQLTFGGAFQRANVYVKNTNDKEKGFFKVKTRGLIESQFQYYRDGVVDERYHLDNIKGVVDFSSHFSAIFEGGRIKYGVAQKMYNLYLKYQWTLGRIPEPPHFPVDRIIQEKLGGKIINWTSLDAEEDYMQIIERARAIAQKENLSLAEWELVTFSRRIDS